MSKLAVLWCFCCACFSLSAQTVPAKVAIIIDDIGYQKADPLLIQLPYALTFAVLPFTPQGAEMASLAASHHKQVILHMPMEAVAQNHLLGKGALRQNMDKLQVQQQLNLALANVPQAVGVNNHMGSLFTSLADQMDWTMQVMAQKQLFFIDSKTTSQSQIQKFTQLHNIKSRSRDIFLDNDKSYAALDRQFNQLMQVAKQHGSAIAIGHPYPETYRYLRRNLARLNAAGIELVPVSQLLDLPTFTAMPQAAPLKTTQHSSAKRQVKLSPNSAIVPASAAASEIAAIAPIDLASELNQIEPLIWHAPYQLALPGFSYPSTEINITGLRLPWWPASPVAGRAVATSLIFLQQK